jgi:tripartite ATP-independent transporter DctM subunit
MNPAQARRPVPLPLKLLFAIVGVSLIFWSLFRLGGSMSPTQLHDTMAPLMFGGLIVFLVIGYPAAFSLGAVGLFFAIFGIRFGLFEPAFLGNMTYQLFSVVSNDLLLAIPFFTFMGAILERCGLAEDLLDSIGQLFGPVRGGLSYAVIIVGAILGAITGTVAASVIAMGVISLPVMMRYGYDMRHATGVIAASGTITQLIPPSLVLVVLADVLQRPVGDMYLGATIPSIIQVALFMGWVLILSFWKPEQVPPLPLEARTLRGWPLLKKALWGIIPSMGLIFMVLGTMFMGLATPTEAGAMGAVGAIALALAKRTFSWKLMNEAASSTMRITAMVVFILIGARTFSLVFQGVGGGEWIAGLLKGLPGGQTGFLIFISAFVFVIAFFLDFFEIAFIIIPLVAPVAEKLGIDLIWFGVLLCANIQTSFMHPPFGFALFYLRGIAPPEVKSSDIYWGSIPWIIMQLMLVAILIIWPGTVTSMLKSTKDIDISKATFTLPPLNMGAGSSSPFGAAPSFGSPPPGLGGLPPGLSPPPGLTPPSIPVPSAPAIPTPAPISVTPPPVTPPVEVPAPAAPAAPAAAPGEVQGAVPAPPAIIDATSPPQTDDLKPKQ